MFHILCHVWGAGLGLDSVLPSLVLGLVLVSDPKSLGLGLDGLDH